MDDLEDRFEDIRNQDAIDERFGFYRYEDGPEQLGWLLGMHAVRGSEGGRGVRHRWRDG